MTVWRNATAAAKKNKEAEPDQPRMRRLVIQDATVEAVARILQSEHGGLLLFQDELSGWFGSHDAYRANGVSKDRSFWLEAYNGGSFTVDRASKEQPLFVPYLDVSIISGIQPEKIRDIAEKSADDGLLQRFMPIPVRAAKAGADVAPSRAVLAAWANLVDELNDMRHGRIDWPEQFRLASDAQDALDAARERLRILATSPAIDSRLSTALAKGYGHLARLVLVFHLAENREGDRDIFADRPVPAAIANRNTAEKAIRLYFNVVVPAQTDFYSRIIGASQMQQWVRRAAGYILAKGEAVVADRDLYREALKEVKEERDRDTVMRQLYLSGWLKGVKKETRGRPTSWIVNPAVHARFLEKAKAERARRAAIVAQIRSSDIPDKPG